MSRVLITNDGPHPPETWAMTTAEQIFDISAMAGDRLIQAQKFQLSIAEILMPHHETVQATERDKLGQGIHHLLDGHDVEDYLDTIMKDILVLARGTPWEAHFARPDVQNAARQMIANHIISSQHVERMWHADRHPGSEIAQTYKAQFEAH
jgi:hypothetical protein